MPRHSSPPRPSEEPKPPSTRPSTRPSFLLPGESHIDENTWTNLSFRERCKSWSRALPTRGGVLPVAYYAVFVPLQLSAWWWFFLKFCLLEEAPGAMTPPQLEDLGEAVVSLVKTTFFGPVGSVGAQFLALSRQLVGYSSVLQVVCSQPNFTKFLVYNFFSELLGIATTSGALGMRLKFPFQTWWYFLTPGTVRTPLFYRENCFRRRLFPEVFLYSVLMALLAHAVFVVPAQALSLQPALYLLPAFAVFGVLSVFDVVVALAARVEIYGYMLFGICLADLA